MSWLYSIIFAGLMLASDGNLQKSNHYNYIAPEVKTVIKADETERFEQTYPLNANGRVSVSNVNGSITIETWDKPEVKLEWIKTGDTKENLAEVEIKIDARQDAFSVQTDYGDWKRRNSGGRSYGKLQVEYRLTVPQTAVLDEIETVNGSVSIANAGNLTKASAVNGQVKGTNLRGTATLSTVNGTVIADFDALATGSRISLETVNGTVDLTLPSDANATLKAETVNGKISNDFGLPVRKGQYVGRDMYGKIGSGDVQIRLESVNGELSVRRKNDGKTLNPATNLLSPKSKSDEDWDNEDFSGVTPRTPRTPKTPETPKTPKTPRTPPTPDFDGANLDAETRKEIEQALKDAQKEVEQALRDARKEIGKMTPEMQREIEAQLRKAKVDFNSKEMQAQMKVAQEKYKEAMAQMANANWSYGSPSIEEKTESFTVKGTPQVTVEAGDCAVTVRGWDKSEVRYALTRVSRRPNQTPVDLKAEQSGSDVNIKIGDGKNPAGNNYYGDANRMRLEVFVPKKTNLKITTGGEIRLEGVSGKIDLRGADESINGRDGDGQLTVNSADARVRIIGFKGEVTAKNADGAMNFEGDFQTLSAQTVDGTIVLTLPENANANIESNRKDVTGEGFALNSASDGKNNFVWKIGGGGNNHRLFTTADGRIIVRNSNALKSVQ
ncbi:MAG: DUF4097 family beta strand repeat-containing protein [Pyrinomonadaceae bacterium]|nr:DUF4097 family beta strand repeat-containing protein [Pyrinomonadaceae bacterium]